jgi:sulfur-oxidizing protein SoxY
MTRRLFLNTSLVLSAIVSLPSVLSAKILKRNDKAFDKVALNDAIKALYGTSETLSGKIKLKAPKIAENGAAVPITVSVDVENVTSISLFVEGNPKALVAEMKVTKYSVPKFSTRIKLGKTSNVVVVAKVGGKLYKISKNVKVTIGGCGG